MMESTQILDLLSDLDDEIDDLEDSIAPFVKTMLSETASKLPLLDKAKLYVLVTYAIESLLFSYLRMQNVNAREHPVFVELTRVKQYFEKIKIAETPVSIRPADQTLDKKAAARFIRAGLSGNEELVAGPSIMTPAGRIHADNKRILELSRKRRLDDTEDEDDDESEGTSEAMEAESEDAKNDETVGARTTDQIDDKPTPKTSSAKRDRKKAKRRAARRDKRHSEAASVGE